MSAPLGSDTRAIAGLSNELAKLQAQVERLQAGASQSDLGVSSIEDGSLIIYDANGDPRTVIGKQEDGSYVGGVPVGYTSPPETPKPPTVTAGFGTARIMTHGSSDPPWPKDFSHVTVWLAKGVEGGTDPLEPGTPVGTIIGFEDSMLVVSGLEPGKPYRCWLTSSNISGSSSDPSDDVVFTPLFVVGPDILDGAIDELKLAAEAVTAAKIAAGAVGDVQLGELVVNVQHLAEGAVEGPKIAPSAIAAGHIAAHAIQTNHIAAGAIEAGNIAVGGVQAENIAAAAVTAEKILGLSITADQLAANSITGGKITAGAITGDHIRAGSVLADVTLETGVAGRRVQISGPANEIRFFPTLGELKYARIFTYLSPNYPDDLTLEMRAIDSTVTNIIPRLYLTPSSVWLGVTNAGDDTQHAGGFVDLQQEGAFFGWRNGAASTQIGMEVDAQGYLRMYGRLRAHERPDPSSLFFFTHSECQAVTGEGFTSMQFDYGLTMNGAMAPLLTVGNRAYADVFYTVRDSVNSLTGFVFEIGKTYETFVPLNAYIRFRGLVLKSQGEMFFQR